jgi:hypothetical protein
MIDLLPKLDLAIVDGDHEPAVSDGTVDPAL